MGVVVGMPCWVDLGTRDAAGAAAFYSRLFGWEVDEPDPLLGYRLCFKDGKLVAGLAQDADADRPWWSTNVAVDDVDVIARLTLEHGGAITSGPGRFGDFGHWLATTDPAGTKVLVFENHAADGAELRAVPGTWASTELIAEDPEGVARFYHGLFGWTLDEDVWRLGDAVVASTQAPAPDWPGSRPSLWTTSFAVDDVDLAIGHALELGARTAVRRADGAAFVLDPQGALFGLVHPV